MFNFTQAGIIDLLAGAAGYTTAAAAFAALTGDESGGERLVLCSEGYVELSATSL